jgi:hypothetical protein
MKPVRKTVCALACGAALLISGTAAWANPSPTGSPGQPGAPGTTCGSPNADATPGNAANANSPFNPDGNAGQHYAGNPGTNSLEHSNSSKAVSQYDIACFQQAQHGH